MRSSRGSSILAVLVALILASPRASAEAPAPGQAEFERGMELYRGRECAAAVGPLEIAVKASPRPGALLALGFCYRQLKQFPSATDAYQRYLRLRADDEKHALSLLEQTTEEEREWRKTNPAPAQQLAVAPPEQVPAAAVAPAPATSAGKSGIGWPIWVAAGAAVVAVAVITGVLVSKAGSTEPSGTFNGR
jgi:hypothetical protein